MSTYAAVSLNAKDSSIKGQVATRGRDHERTALKARDLEAESTRQSREACQLALKQNLNALESQREISILIVQRLRNFAGTQDLRRS